MICFEDIKTVVQDFYKTCFTQRSKTSKQIIIFNSTFSIRNYQVPIFRMYNWLVRNWDIIINDLL